MITNVRSEILRRVCTEGFICDGGKFETYFCCDQIIRVWANSLELVDNHLIHRTGILDSASIYGLAAIIRTMSPRDSTFESPMPMSSGTLAV